MGPTQVAATALSEDPNTATPAANPEFKASSAPQDPCSSWTDIHGLGHPLALGNANLALAQDLRVEQLLGMQKT
jgi:hypothetical protein